MYAMTAAYLVLALFGTARQLHGKGQVGAVLIMVICLVHPGVKGKVLCELKSNGPKTMWEERCLQRAELFCLCAGTKAWRRFVSDGCKQCVSTLVFSAPAALLVLRTSFACMGI